MLSTNLNKDSPYNHINSSVPNAAEGGPVTIATPGYSSCGWEVVKRPFSDTNRIPFKGYR